jgi:hypothetical protein
MITTRAMPALLPANHRRVAVSPVTIRNDFANPLTSHRPVQLRLWDGELPPVSLGLGPASLVSPRVAEDPAGEYDEALRGRLEVHILAGLIKNIGECLGEFSRFGFGGFEIQGGLDVRLVRRGVPGTVPADLADGQPQALEVRSDAQTFRYEGSLDHEDLLPAPACRAGAYACLVSDWRSGET